MGAVCHRCVCTYLYGAGYEAPKDVAPAVLHNDKAPRARAGHGRVGGSVDAKSYDQDSRRIKLQTKHPKAPKKLR